MPVEMESTTALECPRCWEPLEEEVRQVVGPDVTVDVCPQCDGEFLDDREIKRLAGNRDLFALLTSYETYVLESEVACPNCDARMDAKGMDFGDEPIELDVCTSCHGVWLDDGELGKLQASAVDHGELDDATVGEIWDDDVTEDRRKHLLSQLLGGLRRQ